MYKITKANSKGIDQIIDVKLCETRDEAEQFIKNCNALPKEYKQPKNKSNCVYELSHS